MAGNRIKIAPLFASCAHGQRSQWGTGPDREQVAADVRSGKTASAISLLRLRANKQTTRIAVKPTVSQPLESKQPPSSQTGGTKSSGQRRLNATDAIDIWIARWLRFRRKDILAKYGCDPRRIYEIWEEKTFPGSRQRALAVFRERYPTLVDRVDLGPHRRISRAADPDQLGLFD